MLRRHAPLLAALSILVLVAVLPAVASATGGFTLKYAAGTGGVISGIATQTVGYDTSGTPVTAVPITGPSSCVGCHPGYADDVAMGPHCTNPDCHYDGFPAHGVAAFHFVAWSDESTANPRTDISVRASVDVTATFAIDTYTLRYAAGSGGTLSGATSQTVDYDANGTVVTARPHTGYHFVEWSDGLKAASRSDKHVTHDVKVTAHFARNPVYTTTRLSGASTAKAGASLKLTGTVTPAAAPGTVTLSITHLVGRTWRPAGAPKVRVSAGKYAYSFKTKTKGAYRFVSTYSGAVVGSTTYKSSKSGMKSVTVN